jgi:hypothetical protein
LKSGASLSVLFCLFVTTESQPSRPCELRPPRA